MIRSLNDHELRHRESESRPDGANLTTTATRGPGKTRGSLMNESQQTPASNPASPPTTAGLRVTHLRAAWLAILLGFAMEALLLLVTAGFGIFPGLKPVVAALISQVSWSTLVCAGLALGTAVSKARAPVMGLLGLLAAPLALGVSRSLHQGAVKA